MLTRAQRRRLDANGGFLIIDGEEEIPVKRRKRTKPLVSELKKELAMIGLSTEGKKQDLQDRLDCHFMQLNYFNLLPDELVLKILKMAAAKNKSESWAWYFRCKPEDFDHDFIIDVLGKISNRFFCISKDSNLWKGTVRINKVGNKPRTDRLINSFLGDRVEQLIFDGKGQYKKCNKIRPEISAENLHTIASKCTSLKRLKLHVTGIESWPLHCTMHRLEELDIFDTSFNTDTFKNMKLRHILPQLKSFKGQLHAEGLVWLPDMRYCKDLQEVYVDGGDFCFPPMPTGKVPFPRGLKRLTFYGYGKIINCSQERLKKYMKDLDCELHFTHGMPAW